MQALGGKNHITSHDKKITHPLRTKKNHKNSWGEKLTQPLRTKNHATAQG